MAAAAGGSRRLHGDAEAGIYRRHSCDWICCAGGVRGCGSDDLAQAYVSEGKFTQSEPLAREALAFQVTKEPDNWQHFLAESLVGASLAGEKRYVEAEPLLLEGYRGMLERKDRMPVPKLSDLDSARDWIAQMYVASGKPEKAKEWRHS